jgi:hypothetical protein
VKRISGYHLGGIDVDDERPLVVEDDRPWCGAHHLAAQMPNAEHDSEPDVEIDTAKLRLGHRIRLRVG